MTNQQRFHARHFSRIGALPAVALILMLLSSMAWAAPARADTIATVTNFDSAGHQITRYDTQGNAIDAHDGEIHQFGNTYYFYGTSYGCGYTWQQAGTPFCGFRVYASTDLVHWVNHGTVFDATTATCQSRCGPNGNVNVQGNCFRPHVLYNTTTRLYVLWIKDYTAAYHFRVFESATPLGPFTEIATPMLALPNAGDENLFEDDNGVAYIIYTDRNDSYDLAIEQLNSRYESGSGTYIKLGLKQVEAPSMFKRNGIYYVQYGCIQKLTGGRKAS